MTTVQANPPVPFTGAVAAIAGAAQSNAVQQNGIAPVVNQVVVPVIQNAQQPAAPAQDAPQPFYRRILPNVNARYDALRNNVNARYDALRNRVVDVTNKPFGERVGKIFRNFAWTAVIWFPSNFIFKTWITVACVTAYGVIHVIYKKPFIFSEDTYKFIHNGFSWAGAIGAIRNVVLAVLETSADMSSEYYTVAVICAVSSAIFYNFKNKAPEAAAQQNVANQVLAQAPVQPQVAAANQAVEQPVLVQEPAQPQVPAANQAVEQPVRAQEPVQQPLPTLLPMTTATTTTGGAQTVQTAANTTTGTVAVTITQPAITEVTPLLVTESITATTTTVAQSTSSPTQETQPTAAPLTKTEATRRARRNRWKPAEHEELQAPQQQRTRRSPRTTVAPQTSLEASTSSTTTQVAQ